MVQLAISIWHTLSGTEKQAWETNARPHHMTGYNYFLSQALRPNPGIYLPLAGGTMAGAIDMALHKVTSLLTPTSDTDAAHKKYVDDHVPASSIPAGLIAMWHGLLANIPTGWHLCDGTTGTPDLRSSFVKGAAPGVDPGASGGAATHGHNQHEALVHDGTAVDAHSVHSGAAVADHAAKNSNSSATGGYYGIYGGEYVVNTQHAHWITAYTHSVTQPAAHANHAVTQPSNHAAQSHNSANNEPVFYAVAFIMKL